MATLNAGSVNKTQSSGDKGAVNAHGFYSFSAAQVGDKVRLLRLYPGTKIYDTKMIVAALGAGTTVSIGYEFADGTAGGSAAALIPATSTANAGKTTSTIAPLVVGQEFYVTATVGGAAATGRIDVVIDYEFEGNL